MALAYHILAHRNPSQVARLLKAIYHRDDVFVLHFDLKADARMHVLGRELTKTHPNVFLQKPRRVLWGGPQIPDLQIEAMEIALDRSTGWTHFINLSGQDFPLRARSEIIAHLGRNPLTSYLNWFDPYQTNVWTNLKPRVEHYHLHWPWLTALFATPAIGRRLKNLLGWKNQIPTVWGYRRKRPPFFQYFGGSNHAVLSRAACDHLVHNAEAQKIRRWLAATAIPDESVFQSVLLNSPLASQIENQHWRYFKFERNNPNPATLRLSDYPTLQNSGAWFARKFDEGTDSEILGRLEQFLSHS